MAFAPPAAERHLWQWGLGGAALLILSAAGIWRLSIRSPQLVDDSPDFAVALHVWDCLVYCKNNTPRSAKRFKNRVRYYAMMEHPSDVPRSIWHDIYFLRHRDRDGLTDDAERRTAPDGKVPVEILVALGALEHVNRQWIEDDALWLSVRSGSVAADGENEPLTAALRRAIQEHACHHGFGSWPPSEEQRHRVLEISAGIRS